MGNGDETSILDIFLGLLLGGALSAVFLIILYFIFKRIYRS